MRLGRQRVVTVTVARVQPGSRLVTESRFTGLRPRMEMNFVTLGDTSCDVESGNVHDRTPCNTLRSSYETHQSISTPSKAIASDSITSAFSIAFSGE